MKNYNQCKKCGNMAPDNKLTSVLYDDPDYEVCEDCLQIEDYNSTGNDDP